MITVFIPCRAGSERIPHKNTRPFAGYPGGLIELKLRQAAVVGDVGRIVISTDDRRIPEIVESLDSWVSEKVVVVRRPDRYARSDTSFGAFIKQYVTTLDLSDVILWTHVTSPLMRAHDYEAALSAYFDAVGRGHDSLVTVTHVQEFLWRDGTPLNYDPDPEPWPRSQGLQPVHLFNHAAYIIDQATLRRRGDRIGQNPYFHEIPDRAGFDIDWPEQFTMAEDLTLADRARHREV